MVQRFGVGRGDARHYQFYLGHVSKKDDERDWDRIVLGVASVLGAEEGGGIFKRARGCGVARTVASFVCSFGGDGVTSDKNKRRGHGRKNHWSLAKKNSSEKMTLLTVELVMGTTWYQFGLRPVICLDFTFAKVKVKSTPIST